MDSTYFTVAQAGFVVLTAICLALVLYGVRTTLLRMGWDAKRTNRRALLVTAVLFGWVAFAGILAL